jgi:predicted nucleic-acid-binding protein
MKAIDTNVLIRFITKDDDQQAQSVYRLFKNAEENQEKFFIPLLVVLEVIWVLESCYDAVNDEIMAAFSDLLLLPVLQFESEAMLKNFLDSARDTPFDLSDLLIAHSAHAFDCQSTLTFDKKAAKFNYFELLT